MTGLAPNVVVNALAGTGKTWTVTNAVHKLFGTFRTYTPTPEQQAIWDMILSGDGMDLTNVCVTSFSTDATEQLEKAMPKGVSSASTYGLGLRAAKVRGEATRIDRGDWKYGRFLTAFMTAKWPNQDRWKGARMDLLELCKKSRLELFTKVDPTTLTDLADHYGIDIPYTQLELAVEAVNFMLEQGLHCTDEFDYVDMVWIPVIKCWVEKLYDQLFVDEYQDMGKAQQEVCYRIARRINAIGDPNQAIYGFIGADANATENFRMVLNQRTRGVEVLPLTYTRRCSHAVVERSNKLVPALKALPEAPDGEVTDTSVIKVDYSKWTPEEMIICPTNAPLVSLLFRMQKKGVRGFIRKSDIIDSMIAYVKSHTKGIEELRTAIDRMLDQANNKGGRKSQVSKDKYGCLAEIAAECTTTDQVVRTIEAMFPTKESPKAVRMSTVHRSKGLEEKNIVFWEWDRCGQFAEQPWEHVQARNLEYVGCTRAKQNLILARSYR